VFENDSYFDWEILDRPHYVIGAIVLCLCNIIVMLGLFTWWRLSSASWKTRRAMMAKNAHKYLASFLMLIALI